ncbi:MAG: OmpA family protein [Bacteroidales bacterium]|nr:OmpA family protein [Bacteroidales bacterium]
MKRWLTLFIFLLVIASASVDAQEVQYDNATGNKHEVFTNNFGSNWFFSLGGGAEVLFGNDDTAGSFGKRISPTLNFGVGKWFTPGIGLRLQYSGLQARGFSYTENDFTKSWNKDEGYYKQKFNYMNLHGDVLFNLSSLIAGYNPDRVYEVIPYLGGGLTHTYSKSKRQALALNFGIINRFKVADSWDLNLELASMGTQNKFDDQLGGSRDLDGVVSVTAGVTYHFNPSGFRKPQVARQVISEAELKLMRDKMNEMASQNQNLEAQLLEAERKPEVAIIKETEKTTPDIAPRAVFFAIGSSSVSSQEVVNLGFLADQMKQYPNLKFNLTGFADASTGSADLNKRLSKQRAQSVVEVLVNTYNIDRNRLAVQSVGGVDKYDKDYLNRMVLVEVVE